MIQQEVHRGYRGHCLHCPGLGLGVPLQKFPVHFKVCQGQKPLPSKKGLALSKMKFHVLQRIFRSQNVEAKTKSIHFEISLFPGEFVTTSSVKKTMVENCRSRSQERS